ncbi:MAG: L-threonylcarbamoyladenylate synthase [Bacteroidota bacterium]|nr:L-threonylcarbamoyladenylate synthase [Bacteroidota bacterium]
MTYISKDIATAAALLENDQVIAIPTETVYGLAGNALNPSVINKIYKIKNRPLTNPLIIHLHDTTHIEKYVKNIPGIAKKLAEHFWPGPITLLLPKSDLIPDAVTAGLPHVAIRIPNHPVALELLRKLSFPLAAPSANPFGYISPTSAGDVKRILSGKIEFILEGGVCGKGIESTIVGFDGDTAIIYRVGAICSEAIRKVAGKVETRIRHTGKSISSGMLPSHYAPHTPLYLTDDIGALIKSVPCVNTAILSFKRLHSFIPENNQEILSETGDLDEAAHNLYKALHQLDSLKLERIIAERVPEVGIGVAINDRLERAANKNYKND